MWHCLLGIAFVFYSTQAMAEDPHNHGSDGIPTWYDADCCHQRDCTPVEDSTIQFGMSVAGKPVVIYTEPGSAGDSKTFVYEKERWRWSKDERYHACRRGVSPLCVYIRPGV